jgi:Na+-driven multidrug efflux pump
MIECCGTALAMFLNGSAAVRFQIYISITFGIVCIALKVFLVKHLGLIGVPWATIASYILIEALPWMFFVPRALRILESKSLAAGAMPEKVQNTLQS